MRQSDIPKFLDNTFIQLITGDGTSVLPVVGKTDISLIVGFPEDTIYGKGDTLDYFATIGVNCFRCKSVITSEEIKNGRKEVTVSIPDSCVIFQRRKYARIPVEVPVKFALIGELVTSVEMVEDMGIRSSLLTGATIDISSGGLLLKADIDIPQEQKIYLEMPIGEGVQALCKVLRSRVSEVDNSFTVSTEFTRLDVRSREEIINFIFNKTWEMNKARTS